MFHCEGGDEPGDDQPQAGRGGETTLSCKFKGTVSRDWDGLYVSFKAELDYEPHIKYDQLLLTLKFLFEY